MPDRLSEDTSEHVTPARRRVWRQAVLIVLAFVVVGVGCGFLWAAIWDPAPGVVVDHTWYPSPWESGQQSLFSATGWYVVIATLAGLALGLLAAFLLADSELVTLVAVLAGSLLAGWTMRLVGMSQSPTDPQSLAAKLPDKATLPSAMDLWTPATWLAFPFGALLAVTVVFLLIGRTELPRDPDQDGAPSPGTETLSPG